MRTVRICKSIFPYIAVIFASFLFSYSVRAFINKAGFLTGGVSGVSLLISRYIGKIYYNVSFNELLGNNEYMVLVNSLTSIIYFLINIPIIVLAFRKLGKRFAILSTIYIICNTLFIRFLPNEILNIFNLETDNLSYALFAGALSGCAISLTLNVGGSSGGLEVIATYFSHKKQISIGKFMIMVNAVIICAGGIIFQNWTPMLFTLVYIFVSGRVVDTLHRFTKKVVVYVIAENYQEIANEISRHTKYNSTVWKALGGYTGNEKYALMIIVPERQADKTVYIVQSIDKDAFITIIDSNKVYGNFYIEPLK